MDARHDDGRACTSRAISTANRRTGNLWEAWAEIPLGERHWVRAGRQRVPLGSELATRNEGQAVIGDGFPAFGGLYGGVTYGMNPDSDFDQLTTFSVCSTPT